MIGFAGLVPNCPERVWYVTGGFGAGVADVAGDGNGVLAVAVAGVAGNGNGGLAFAVLGVHRVVYFLLILYYIFFRIFIVEFLEKNIIIIFVHCFFFDMECTMLKKALR